ncbi:hypothetical protein IH575_01790 [Candidatus Dojkabacteria bacterium]|nr:hypothetical protein [Candidatus Dojkabacteria bacterium]
MRPLDSMSLKTLVWKNFDDNTFSLLCIASGINADALPNRGLIEKANYLVDEAIRIGRINEVFSEIYRLRPDLIEGIFIFDESAFASTEVLLRDPTLISVPEVETSERIIQMHVDDPTANTLLVRVQELSTKLEVLADPVAQETLFAKLEEASQIVRSKWNEAEYQMRLGRAEFLINSTSAEIFRLDKQREIRLADVNSQIEAENKVRQDEAKLNWIIPAIITVYALLIIGVVIGSFFLGYQEDAEIPFINVPLSILVWSGVGSLSSLIYRYYRRIKKSSLTSEIRLAFGKFWIGLVSGTIFYFALRSGLFLLSNSELDINQSPLGQQQFIWVLVWLISFSDFVFDRVVSRIAGNVIGEESERAVSSIIGVSISDVSDIIERSNSRQLSEFRRLTAQAAADNDIESNKVSSSLENPTSEDKEQADNKS